jgi:hypothetical protein
MEHGRWRMEVRGSGLDRGDDPRRVGRCGGFVGCVAWREAGVAGRTDGVARLRVGIGVMHGELLPFRESIITTDEAGGGSIDRQFFSGELAAGWLQEARRKDYSRPRRSFIPSSGGSIRKKIPDPLSLS